MDKGVHRDYGKTRGSISTLWSRIDERDTDQKKCSVLLVEAESRPEGSDLEKTMCKQRLRGRQGG